MSHAGSWRAACNMTIRIPLLQVDFHEEARGVTDPGVGSGALFGALAYRGAGPKYTPPKEEPLGRG
jgi:hypothetical protein